MKTLLTAFLITLVLTVVTGLIYPLVVIGIAQVVFPRQANGSLIEVDRKAVGSELIGQPFSGPRYFWGRPSATGPFPYNAAASSGSNYGPSNDDLLKAVRARIEALRAGDPGNEAPSPIGPASRTSVDRPAIAVSRAADRPV